MRKISPLLAMLFVMGVCSAVTAQAPSDAASGSPQARREQLAKVQEMLSDPDPLMRLANMEAIVNSGDALRIQIATRAAFASDDADLRGLALRAYIATHRQLTFDIQLPAAVQKGYDAATASTMPELDRQYPYLRPVSNAAFRLQLKILDYTLSQDSGTIEGAANRAAPFVISGEELSTRVDPGGFFPECYVDFRPSRKQTLDGTLACQQGWPKLAISAPAS